MAYICGQARMLHYALLSMTHTHEDAALLTAAGIDALPAGRREGVALMHVPESAADTDHLLCFIHKLNPCVSHRNVMCMSSELELCTSA